MTTERPDCMARLGLLPPYALEDVKQAYATKATTAHPDHGGSVDEFLGLHHAYQAAKEYVGLHGDRRQWIASMVARSLRQDQLIKRLKRYGAFVATDSGESLEASLGDFASLVESIVEVQLVDSGDGDAVIQLLAEDEDARSNLRHLSLAGSQVSDRAVKRLKEFISLSCIDLRKTPITQNAISFVSALPALTRLDLRGTDVAESAWQGTEQILQRRRSGLRFEPHVTMTMVVRRQWPPRP